MELTLIAALAKNNVIGKDGQTPWYIPEDLQRFKLLTVGYPVIMGRKTYESIPEKVRPLKKRLNVVLTQQDDYNSNGIYVVHSLEDALSSLQEKRPFQEEINYDRAFVIGGGSIYREALPLANRLELTHVHKEYEGDTLFPKVNFDEWVETEHLERNGYSFSTYIRKPKRE